VLSTDFALIWGEKIVQKARFLINAEYIITILLGMEMQELCGAKRL
jgi:hypothetical protein